MQTVNISFEVTSDVSADQLHELLCKLIHEGDREAWEYLNTSVSNVGQPLDENELRALKSLQDERVTYYMDTLDETLDGTLDGFQRQAIYGIQALNKVVGAEAEGSYYSGCEVTRDQAALLRIVKRGIWVGK